ncbi:MAG: hypothetical protein DSY80_06545 [Desulfocapsa sp.]|nr:MAG: hypothetical protein DSY80_06545 [Desulfocapsa sp.]
MKDSISREQARTEAVNNSTAEISKVAVTAIGIGAGLIGVWAVACIIAGISSSGGSVELVSNFFKAITG